MALTSGGSVESGLAANENEVFEEAVKLINVSVTSP
jgi:hypothetical protein